MHHVELGRLVEGPEACGITAAHLEGDTIAGSLRITGFRAGDGAKLHARANCSGLANLVVREVEVTSYDLIQPTVCGACAPFGTDDAARNLASAGAVVGLYTGDLLQQAYTSWLDACSRRPDAGRSTPWLELGASRRPRPSLADVTASLRAQATGARQLVVRAGVTGTAAQLGERGASWKYIDVLHTPDQRFLQAAAGAETFIYGYGGSFAAVVDDALFEALVRSEIRDGVRGTYGAHPFGCDSGADACRFALLLAEESGDASAIATAAAVV